MHALRAACEAYLSNSLPKIVRTNRSQASFKPSHPTPLLRWAPLASPLPPRRDQTPKVKSRLEIRGKSKSLENRNNQIRKSSSFTSLSGIGESIQRRFQKETPLFLGSAVRRLMMYRSGSGVWNSDRNARLKLRQSASICVIRFCRFSADANT